MRVYVKTVVIRVGKAVNFSTSKTNIHNYSWTSPDGKTDISIDNRWLSILLDVMFFRGAECDSDNYLVVAVVSERL
jgi:hypothetical protein